MEAPVSDTLQDAVEDKTRAGSSERLTISLDFEDFARTLGRREADAIRGRTEVLDGGAVSKDLHERITEALPKVLSKRLEGMIPTDFVIHEIEMKIGVDAKVFGAGVSGEATVKFGPRTPGR